MCLLNEPGGTCRAQESCVSAAGAGHFPPVLFPASGKMAGSLKVRMGERGAGIKQTLSGEAGAGSWQLLQ